MSTKIKDKTIDIQKVSEIKDTMLSQQNSIKTNNISSNNTINNDSKTETQSNTLECETKNSKNGEESSLKSTLKLDWKGIEKLCTKNEFEASILLHKNLIDKYPKLTNITIPPFELLRFYLGMCLCQYIAYIFHVHLYV